MLGRLHRRGTPGPIGRAARLLCIGALAAPVSLAAPASSQPRHTIGLVLTSWKHALYATPAGKEECPSGFAADEKQQFLAMKNADEQLKAFGNFEARGPNGESGRFNPTKVDDPIPHRELETRKGFGLNLDGTPDGRATPKTCRHEKFSSPEGVQVDNQIARVVGCTLGWRTDGFATEFIAKDFENSPLNRVVIEITGVDSEKNDPAVMVTIAKGRDKLVASTPGRFVPFLVQRIDDRYPRYIQTTGGRIIDGVLTTDPIPVMDFSTWWVNHQGERRIRDLRLRLKLTPDGAEGFVGGYEDLKYWLYTHSKSVSGNILKFSYPNYYYAALRYADGHKDPASGQCRAISAAYKVTAVRAQIPHNPKGQSHVAMSYRASAEGSR